MGLVVCPECDKEISEHAELCTNCGFPIKEFMIKYNIFDTTKAFICPKCADNYKINCIPLKLKCEYCKTVLVQTDISMDDLFLFSHNSTDEEFNNKSIELAKKFGNNQFDENAYNDRLQKRFQEIQQFTKSLDKKLSQQQNVPKCPMCGSINISKISTLNRTASIVGFGILSKKIGKQWQCNNPNCKHLW